MIEIGNYNTLKINRKTSIGLYLSDSDGNSVLLPNKYVPADYTMDRDLQVFCYLDHEERPIATTLKPFIKRNEFGFLRVAAVNEVGAFLDWGLEKHLLVPFREQQVPMIEGQWYVVFCYMDSKSFRLVASGRLKRFFDNKDLKLTRGEQVDLLATRRTDLGWEVVVNQKHKGLIYESDIFQTIAIGDRLIGYVKKIREDNNLDVSLEPLGHLKLEPSAQKIYDKLIENDGKLELHDRSDPLDIKSQLQMSKKTFKKAIGILYKSRKIEIKEDGIYKI